MSAPMYDTIDSLGNTSYSGWIRNDGDDGDESIGMRVTEESSSQSFFQTATSFISAPFKAFFSMISNLVNKILSLFKSFSAKEDSLLLIPASQIECTPKSASELDIRGVVPAHKQNKTDSTLVTRHKNFGSFF